MTSWRKRVDDRPTAIDLPDDPELDRIGEIAREPETHAANLGPSVQIRGELSADEDVTIEGRVEGKVSLHGCILIVGQTGCIHAEVHAHSVVIEGEVVGDITAADRVEVTGTGSLQGDIRAARVVLAEGATFRGRIDMGNTGGRRAPAAGDEPRAEPQPVEHSSRDQNAMLSSLFDDQPVTR